MTKKSVTVVQPLTSHWILLQIPKAETCSPFATVTDIPSNGFILYPSIYKVTGLDPNLSMPADVSNTTRFPSNYTKITCPRFNGEDFRGWLLKIEQFFVVDNTQERDKVRLVMTHLDGRALQWHQWFMVEQGSEEQRKTERGKREREIKGERRQFFQMPHRAFHSSTSWLYQTNIT